MPDDQWANLSTDEKLDWLRGNNGQQLAELRLQIGDLKTQIVRLRQQMNRMKT
jgi:hypothetical protein